MQPASCAVVTVAVVVVVVVVVVVSFREGERGQFIHYPGTPALPCHYYELCSRYSTTRLGVRWWCSGGVVVYTHGGWGALGDE